MLFPKHAQQIVYVVLLYLREFIGVGDPFRGGHPLLLLNGILGVGQPLIQDLEKLRESLLKRA
jgi:hypothetical protein